MEKEKLLICDDEEGVLESLRLILSQGYQTLLAKDGDEAVSIVRSDSGIKAVLLDIKMPGKGGLEVLKEIKSYDKNIPVIVVTGYQSVEAAAEAIRRGASNYIVKPFDSKSVLNAVKEATS